MATALLGPSVDDYFRGFSIYTPMAVFAQFQALRAGKQGSFLLLTDDGTPPTQVHIDGYGDLVFEPVAELTIPPGRI